MTSKTRTEINVQARAHAHVPTAQGLYNPRNEKDACGVGLVAHIDGRKSHEVVENALQVLEHMDHRGAEGADSKTGDGAGIMVQVPHEFILLQGIPVPEKGRYATGMVFMSKDRGQQELTLSIIREVIQDQGLSLTHVRNVPVNSNILGEMARETEPAIRQLIVCDEGGAAAIDIAGFEKRVYVARRRIEKAVRESEMLWPETKEQFYVVSLSTRTIVYKGMLSSKQLRFYFTDLINPYFTSGIALVHSRFSTNTFPKWHLAQPFRLLGHNGEINTIRGNRSWMTAREALFEVDGFGDMENVFPIVQEGMSDSASLDNVLEFFVASGLTLPHALAMLVPESYNDSNPIPEDVKAFYEYHSIFMEPWDGPAALLFSDGRYAGGMLDRNGLRPARYLVTKDNTVVLASETGVLDVPATHIVRKGRLRPGKIFMIDTQEGRLMFDDEIKGQLAHEHPYREWLHKNRVILSKISSGRKASHSMGNLNRQMKAFGYSREDIDRVILPMSRDAAEPMGSMGDDTPPAVFSDRPQLLFRYFRQQFAQVTNPPIDPLREGLVMSLTSYIGAVDSNVLHPSEKVCKVVKLPGPVITNKELDILCNLRYKGFNTRSLPMLFNPAEGAAGVDKALDELCRMAEQAVDDGINYVVLSDRGTDATHAPIPSLLALSKVHHQLIKARKRTKIALIVETGEAREVMHIALLAGFGASAVNPYMVFAILDDLVKRKELQLNYETAEKRYVKAMAKGMLKIIAKMGISTIRSYRGAEIFEAYGLSKDFLDRYFHGMSSSIGGADLEDIVADTLKKHAAAFEGSDDEPVAPSGEYAFRRSGIPHMWNPAVIDALQEATRNADYGRFKEYERLSDEKERPAFIRDLVDIKRNPIDISKVESVESIMKRFVTGAMSFGSINAPAHEAIARAMNAIGGKSNTGEGGEDPARYKPAPDGSSTRSAIKQVASGRFGVNTEYLVNADELQIKVAQGAKPGEGGQLPGYKVNEIIARTRHSLPGITLISPPPHHDIYSIEDLAQLIFDLKNVNPTAAISVKLVSEGGIGTIAAGVAKAKADTIIISGCDGGTGASPMSSIKHAGLPMEPGLAEVQQTLVLNNLRGNVTLQVDGQMKTARDIIVSALLGAEEYGFSTAALIVLGCRMLRQCHSNTCPMGVATQNPELVKRFKGKSEHLVTFFRFLAQSVREHLAEMGFTCIDDIIGRSDLLVPRKYPEGDKLSKIDLSKILYRPEGCEDYAVRHVKEQDHKLDSSLDKILIALLRPSIEFKTPAQLSYPIHNTDRSVGAMLSGEVTRLFGSEALPDGTIQVSFKGSAGQSFGAFLCKGITFRLVGDANDYLGKSLSGGRIIVTPLEESAYSYRDNIIAGNTLLYGATEGEVYINGVVGERFCVRNSGATAVVEGVGDHCCEYMTGGRVVVLGTTGRNFAAGMSGGVAYVWNRDGDFDYYCNMELVELSLVETQADLNELHSLILAHLHHTDSTLAREMLGNWDVYSKQFIKVIPTEYKRILDAESEDDA